MYLFKCKVCKISGGAPAFTSVKELIEHCKANHPKAMG